MRIWFRIEGLKFKGVSNKLNKVPLPSVEETYAHIRREISRREILTKKQSSGYDPLGIGSRLVTKEPSSEFNSSRTGVGLITKPKRTGDHSSEMKRIKITSIVLTMVEINTPKRGVSRSSDFQSGGKSSKTEKREKRWPTTEQ